MAAPYAAVGLAGNSARGMPKRSAYWLLVAIGLVAVGFAILAEGNVFNPSAAGHENNAGEGMAIGLAGLAKWVIALAAFLIYGCTLALQNPRALGKALRQRTD
jgi:hypothetical protein